MFSSNSQSGIFYLVSKYYYNDYRRKIFHSNARDHRDRMVVRFTTNYAISAYHHWCCEFESRSRWGVQHYVIKYVSDLR